MKEYFDTNHDDVVSFIEVVQFFFHFITKVVLYVILVLLVLIFFFFLFYFVDLLYNISSGEDKPPLFDAYIIVSPSMVPTINVEDAIIIQRINPAHIKQGDIISFLARERLLLIVLLVLKNLLTGNCYFVPRVIIIMLQILF